MVWSVSSFRRMLALSVSMFLLLMWVPGIFSALPALAATDGGFEIDGNAIVNSVGNSDWASVKTQPDVQDNTPTDTTVFSASSKEGDNPSTWGGGGGTPGKIDFVNIWSYTHNVGTTPYFDLAYSRLSNTGTGSFFLELNKLGNTTNPNLISIPTRSDGDLRFQIKEQGNSGLNLDDISMWVSGAWVSQTILDAAGFDYAINSDSVDMPGQSNIDADELVEISLDLKTLLGLTPSCPALFGTANLRAITGNSDKNLEDYVNGFSIDAGSTCSTLTIQKKSSGAGSVFLAGATFQIAPDPTPGSNAASVLVTDNDTTPAAGHIADSDPANGIIKINPAEAGTYTVTETSPPPGWLIDSGAGVTDIAPAGGDAPTKTFTDSLGSLAWEKVDAVDQAHICCATFVVHRTDADSVVQGDVTVVDNGANDADNTAGHIKVVGLKTGHYTVTETVAPAGYGLPTPVANQVQSAQITSVYADRDVVLGTAFADPRAKVALTVFKIQDGTENNPVALSGAIFKLYLLNGASPDQAVDTLIGTCTTAADGTCTIQAEWGHTYYWLEVAPPPGYSLPVDNVGTPFPVAKADIANGVTTTFADISPTISTTATNAVVGGTIKDTVTIGNLRPDATGTVTFKLYGPIGLNDNVTTVSCSGNLLHTFVVNVVLGTSTYSSDGAGDVYTPAQAGKYAWIASYSGDTDGSGHVRNAAVSGNCADQGETSTVSKTSPTITTTASDSNVVDGSITDTATLHGFFGTPTGTVTFNVYTDCSAAALATSTVNINANGTATSDPFQLNNSHGTYYWSANYNGDPNNSATNQSNCGLVDANNNEVSHAPVLDAPHKYNDPGTDPNASTSDTTVSIYPSNNQVNYTITVHNSGGAAMNGVHVSDPLSALATYNNDIACGGDATSCITDDSTTTLKWSFNLPADGTATLTFSVTVKATDVNGDDITNQASVTNGDTVKQTEKTHNPVAFPILALAKHSTPLPREDGADGVVAPNSTIVYTLTISNTGDADAVDAAVTDQVPTGTTYVSGSAHCQIGLVTPCTAGEGLVSGHPTASWTVDVPANGSVDLIFSVTVDAGAVNAEIISNHGHYDWQSGTLASDSRTITHIVEFPVITGDKDASPLPREDNNAPGVVHPGDFITYTVTATNSGLAGSDMTVTDTVPAGTSYLPNSASCGAGTSNCAISGPDVNGLITWTFHLAGGTLDNQTITPAQADVTFQVVVSAGDHNGQILSNFATVNGVTTRTVTHVVTFPIVNVHKSSDPASGTVADPAPVVPGQKITYTLTVSNAGLQDASNVTVTDSVPAGTTYNGDASCGDAPDQTCTVGEAAGLITWHLTVPAGSGDEQAITPFVEHLTFSVSVDAGDANGTLIDNTAAFTQNHTPDCVRAGDGTCATETTHHEVEFPIIDVHKSSDPVSGTVNNPTPVVPGQPISYTLTVSNAGLADATNETVTDTIPAGTTYSGDASCGDAPSGTCTVDDSVAGVITWHLTVPAGTAQTPFVEHLTFSVTVDSGDSNGTLIDNTAAFTGSHTPDCIPVNQGDCDTETTHHEVEFPVLALVKTANPPTGSIVQRGDQIDYTITVTNTGLAAAPQQVVTDNLPDHVTLVAGSISPAADSVANGVITWTVDVPAATLDQNQQLTPGSVVFTYSVTVDQDAPEGASLINEALIGGECPDGSDCTTDHHVPTGDLTLVKHVDKKSASYGDTLTYTFDAATTGDLNQTNVVVTDVVPAEVSYVDGSAGCSDAGTCTASYDVGSRTVTWELGDMAAGTERHLVFKVTIDTPAAATDGAIPAETIVNSGVIASAETPDTPSNKVKTVVVAVLGVKHVRKPPPPQVLPFTGAAVPPRQALTVAILFIGAGIALTSARRRRDN